MLTGKHNRRHDVYMMQLGLLLDDLMHVQQQGARRESLCVGLFLGVWRWPGKNLAGALWIQYVWTEEQHHGLGCVFTSLGQGAGLYRGRQETWPLPRRQANNIRLDYCQRIYSGLCVSTQDFVILAISFFYPHYLLPGKRSEIMEYSTHKPAWKMLLYARTEIKALVTCIFILLNISEPNVCSSIKHNSRATTKRTLIF